MALQNMWRAVEVVEAEQGQQGRVEAEQDQLELKEVEQDQQGRVEVVILHGWLIIYMG
jgi:hypothetical protein